MNKSYPTNYGFGGTLTIGGGACTTFSGFFLGFFFSRLRASLFPIPVECHRSLTISTRTTLFQPHPLPDTVSIGTASALLDKSRRGHKVLSR